MSALQIALFGQMQLTHQGHPSPEPLTRAMQALLAYLLLYRQQSWPRTVLAGLLWGDVPELQARKRLNTILYRVRHVLEPPDLMHRTYLVTTPEKIGFNTASDYALDVAQFELAVRQGWRRGRTCSHPQGSRRSKRGCDSTPGTC